MGGPGYIIWKDVLVKVRRAHWVQYLKYLTEHKQFSFYKRSFSSIPFLFIKLLKSMMDYY